MDLIVELFVTLFVVFAWVVITLEAWRRQQRKRRALDVALKEELQCARLELADARLKLADGKDAGDIERHIDNAMAHLVNYEHSRIAQTLPWPVGRRI